MSTFAIAASVTSLSVGAVGALALLWCVICRFRGLKLPNSKKRGYTRTDDSEAVEADLIGDTVEIDEKKEWGEIELQVG